MAQEKEPDTKARPPVAERMSVALIADAAAALNDLQARTGLKKVDLINRAIAIYEFVDAELRAGRKIVVRDAEGNDEVIKIFFH